RYTGNTRSIGWTVSRNWGERNNKLRYSSKRSNPNLLSCASSESQNSSDTSRYYDGYINKLCIKVIGKKELEITFTYQDEYQKAIQLIQLAEQTSQRKVG